MGPIDRSGHLWGLGYDDYAPDSLIVWRGNALAPFNGAHKPHS